MSENEIKHFNIRVYGIIINEKKEVLVSDEYMLDTFMTEFPGGGLHFGEGPEDCIRREAMEEFGQEVEIVSHYYTTGFFQKAIFYEDHQLISIYYRLRFTREPEFGISSRAFDFEGTINGSQSFRWIPVTEISEEVMTFPVDRYVFRLLRTDLNKT